MTVIRNSNNELKYTVISLIFFQGYASGRVPEKGGSTAETQSFPHDLQRLRELAVIAFW
jgi:hypothetical protein